jgi:hypothetical protein
MRFWILVCGLAKRSPASGRRRDPHGRRSEITGAGPSRPILYRAHGRYDPWAETAPSAWVLDIVLGQPLASSLEQIQVSQWGART